MKKNKRSLIGLVLSVVLLSVFSAIPASAESAATSANASVLSIPTETNQEVLPTDTIEVSTNDTLTVNRPDFSIMSNFNVTGDLMNFSDSLTVADPTDFWFFNVPTDRSILMQLRSNNPNYRVDLYSIDWSTGTASPTGFTGTSGALKFATDLQAGDWGLRIVSLGTVGDTYSIHMNAANASSPIDPANPTKVAKLTSYSNNLISTVMEYPNGNITMNGTFIASNSTEFGTNSHLDWSRNYTFSNGGNHSSVNHNLSQIKVRSVTTPVKYTSQYASSDNAVLIVLNEGTMFTYFESGFSSGPPTNHTGSFVDRSGRTTPRPLDSIDITGDPDILVYDLNTKKPIDFASSLNFWYATGAEPQPTVVYYN